MTLPNLSQERLEQMIHLAASHKQETHRVTASWVERLFGNLHRKSTQLIYGLGAGAVSLSCVAAIWLLPMLTPQTEFTATSGDFSMSEYMMQDLLEDLTQPTLSPDASFQA
jgi:hypothetical protein